MKPHRFEDVYETTNQLIGSGAFAQVFLAKNRLTGQKAAVKMSNRNNPISQKEKQILRQLAQHQHPYVVKILDVYDQGNVMLIVLEYCSGGTLYEMMISNSRFQLDQIVEIIYQVGQGLQFLHNLNITHRDIKPENVLRQFEEGMEKFKITDFGLSSLKDNGMTTTKVGTAYYVAPEILDGRAQNEGYDKSIDIWALGLMLDELLHGSPFYNGQSEEEVFRKIMQIQYFIRDESYNQATIFDSQKYIIKQILSNTIVREPQKRKDLKWILAQLNEYKEIVSTPPQSQNYNFNNNNSGEQRFQQLDKFQFLQPIQQKNVPAPQTQPQTLPQSNNNSQLYSHQQSSSLSQQQIQQIQQNLNQPSLSTDQSLNYGTSTKKQEKMFASENQVEQQCSIHGYNIMFKAPGIGDKNNQMVGICMKCLTQYGIMEPNEYQQHINQALKEIQLKGFEYYYKPNLFITQVQSIIENLQDSAFLLKQKESVHEKILAINQKQQIFAKQEFLEMIQDLKKVQADQNYSFQWINQAFRNLDDEGQNKICFEISKRMRERRENAVKESKSLLKEILLQLTKTMSSRIESLQ